MREIVSKPLDREAFRPYGDFVDLLHIKQMDATVSYTHLDVYKRQVLFHDSLHQLSSSEVWRRDGAHCRIRFQRGVSGGTSG